MEEQRVIWNGIVSVRANVCIDGMKSWRVSYQRAICGDERVIIRDAEDFSIRWDDYQQNGGYNTNVWTSKGDVHDILWASHPQSAVFVVHSL